MMLDGWVGFESRLVQRIEAAAQGECRRGRQILGEFLIDECVEFQEASTYAHGL